MSKVANRGRLQNKRILGSVQWRRCTMV